MPVEIALDEYKTDDSPIFFPNTIGGYMPGLPAEATRDEVKAALAKGYVVVAPGARGRTNYDDANQFSQESAGRHRRPEGCRPLPALERQDHAGQRREDRLEWYQRGGRGLDIAWRYGE